MLGRTQLIAIVVVIVVAVASAGIALAALNNNENNRTNINAQLEVYGNANGDDRIDQNDLGIIRDIINSARTFSDHPLADSNCDGTVDEADYKMVERIIAAGSGGEKVSINIVNHYAGGTYVDSVRYPITSAVATSSLNGMMVFKCLGIRDEFKGLSSAGGLDSVLFSEYQHFKGKPDLGPNVYTMDIERVSTLIDKENVTAVITEDNVSYAFDKGIFKSSGLDVVRVTPGSVNIEKYVSAVCMVAFLFETGGKGYVQKCSELISWHEDFFTDLNHKLSGVKKVSAAASSMSVYVSSPNSDNTTIIKIAGAVCPLDIDTGSSTTKVYNGGEDTWLNNYELDYLIMLRGSGTGYSWYGGTIENAAGTFRTHLNNWRTLECYFNDNVYIVCGEMPVALRVAYVSQIFYQTALGQDFAYNYHADYVEKFFGWDEDAIKGRPFSLSMSDLL